MKEGKQVMVSKGLIVKTLN